VSDAVGERSPEDITGYHAHVYFDEASRPLAAELRERVAARFAVSLGRWREEPIGPHPRPMYQVAFAAEAFAEIVPWLMLNRRGLVILVHPETGDDLADHRDHALWLGERLALKLDFFG
jgi:aromatic ring-cleaving dioxygenase